MTAAERTPAAAPGRPSNRPRSARSFGVDIRVPQRGALVFDAAPCRVPGCVRQPRTSGLCKGHYYQWTDAGRPDIEAFAATASPGRDSGARS